MKNSDYWRQRFMMIEEAAHAESVEYTKALEREFAKAQRSLQSDIEKWYARFAKNNKISYSEVRRMLNTDQLKEFRWTVQDYIKAGESLDPVWAKQLENASARVHISRLEALQLQLRQQAEALFGSQTDSMGSLFKEIYSNGYYHTAFEIQKGFNLGWDLQSLDPKQLDTMLSKPWTLDGKTFSDRIWTNKTDLINTLHTQLTQGIIRGDGPDKAIDAISNRFKVSKNRANALVMTESAYFSAVAQKDCFNSLDVEKFEVVSTLDGRTCETCGDLDGMVFPMSQYEPGVTANPFHTSCRCCTAPHFDDDYGERAARNVDGEVYYVPSNIKYEDWKKLVVNGATKNKQSAGSLSDNKYRLLPLNVRNDIKAEEKSIATQSNENALVYDRNGKLLSSIEGNLESVAFPKGISSQLKGAIVSHNHPSGKTFSVEDIQMLFKQGMAEIRATTEKGTYILRQPEIWPDAINRQYKIRKEYENILSELRDKYIDFYTNNELSLSQAEKLWIDETLIRFSEKFNLDYAYEEW